MRISQRETHDRVVETQSNVVRFFTGNDCKIVQDNKALQSRMSATFYFAQPGKEIYDAKMKAIDNKLGTFWDNLTCEFTN